VDIDDDAVRADVATHDAVRADVGTQESLRWSPRPGQLGPGPGAGWIQRPRFAEAEGDDVAACAVAHEIHAVVNAARVRCIGHPRLAQVRIEPPDLAIDRVGAL